MVGGSGAGGGGDGGSNGGGGRSKEAVGMMALHESLRNVCLSSDWTYSVFWTIRPRPRCRGGNGCKVGDDNGSLMLMWEDGFCRSRGSPESMEEIAVDVAGDDPVRKAFSKMSIQLYNYGEGLMGKVASDKCHKWVFKEPSECEPNISNYWQSSFDALPPEWTDQFASGIQTIAVIQAGHGLLQLGSCKIIPEDLHFVLRMRHMFESLGYQSGFYLSQLFSSNRSSSPSSTSAAAVAAAAMLKQQSPAARAPPPPPPQAMFNWPNHPQLAPPAIPGFHHNHHHQQRFPASGGAEDTHMFLLPHGDVGAGAPSMEDMMQEHEADLKWPSGLSFFTALTGREDDAKLLFGSGEKPAANSEAASEGGGHGGGDETEDYLGLDVVGHSGNKGSKNATEGGGGGGEKFKRSFTLPARMAASSASSSSMDHHHHHHHQHSAAAAQHGMDYRGCEAGMYSDIMETFLD